jgi:acyl carrier protein phosphodiesterase
VQAISSQQPDQQLQMIEQGVDRLSNGISHLTDNVTQAIKVGAEQLHAASQQLPEQKVIVQHSVPRVMTDLVQSQFQLLYDGLRPVLESSTHNRSQLEALRKSIDDCLQQYRELKTEIDKAN